MARAFDIGWNRLFLVPELGLLQKWKKNGSALQSESNREAAIPMSQHKLVDSNKINTNYQSTFIGMMHGS